MVMNRREFLKAGLAGGILLAPSLRSEAAAARPDSKMSVNYITLPIGAESPFSVLHISDSHVRRLAPTDPESLRGFLASRFVGQENEEALAASFEWAKRHACDYVLHTGDLIDCATNGNVAFLKKFLAENPNLLYAPGNHEYATTYAAPKPPQTEAEFRAVNTEKLQTAAPFDLSFHSQVIRGVNFLMIDNVYGTVAPATVERFHAEAKKGLPIVLCQHVPFFTPGIALAHARSHTTNVAFDNLAVPMPSRDFSRQSKDPVTAEFVRYLKSEPLLKAILAGHYHSGMADRFSSTAMQYIVGGNFRYCGQEILIY